jgi:hypothetical protein
MMASDSMPGCWRRRVNSLKPARNRFSTPSIWPFASRRTAAVAVELTEIDPGPERLLEVRELHLCAPQQQRALHDHAPGHDRGHEQHEHDHLHRDARFGNQGPERQLLVHAGISIDC